MNREVFKQTGRKGLICALILTMTLSVASPALAAESQQPQSPKVEFSDISGHWAEKDILAMCEGENPLFNGVGTDANGKAIFAPASPMTGYEFITVIVRALYPDEIRATQPDESWWQPTYEVAVSHNLLYNDLDLSKPISRQSMAKIMAKVLKKTGEDTSKLVPTSKIADYDTVGSYYQHDVRVVYSLGIITGVDANGTFAPTGTIDRAQGATILHRLLDKSCRATVDFSDTSSSSISQGHQEFKEGEPHVFPKVGDVVIKADGTRVVLTETVVGQNKSTGKDIKVLGFQQGVDYVTGTGYTTAMGLQHLGYDNDGTAFVKCERTGEVFTKAQWKAIEVFTGKELSHLAGDYDGEIYNMYWKWSAERQEWDWDGGIYY